MLNFLNNKMKRKLMNRGILIIVVFLCHFPLLYAVPPGPGDGGAPPNSIPVDGGASLLAAAGAAYGIKKYRDYRKSRQEEEDI